MKRKSNTYYFEAKWEGDNLIIPKDVPVKEGDRVRISLEEQS